jgi:hypothetical protein
MCWYQQQKGSDIVKNQVKTDNMIKHTVLVIPTVFIVTGLATQDDNTLLREEIIEWTWPMLQQFSKVMRERFTI